MDKGLVSFDGSLLFFLFFFLLHLLECFAGQSSKRGTFFFFFAEEIIIFSPIQKETQLFYFLFNFWMIFAPVSLPWYCKDRDRSSRGLLPPSACCILSFLCLSHKIMSSFSICQVPVQSGLLLISLPTHFDSMPFLVIPDVGLNVNLNTQGAKSVTAYLQAERAPVSHLAPALFSSKEVNLGTGTRGLRGQKPRDASCTVVSEKDFCSPCLVKALSLTTPLKTHYSLFRLTCRLAPVGFVITSSDLTLVHGALKQCAIYAI